MPWTTCEKEYGSANRCEHSLLQILPSQRPNLPSGPSGDLPIHSSMPPVRTSTARKAPMVQRRRLRWEGTALVAVRQRCHRAPDDEHEAFSRRLMRQAWHGQDEPSSWNERPGSDAVHLGRTTILSKHKLEIRNPKSETNPKHQSGNDQNHSTLGGFDH